MTIKNRETLELAYRAAELYLSRSEEKLTAKEIAKRINEEMHPPERVTREGLYRLLKIAKENGIIRLFPPSDLVLEAELAKKFPNCHGRFKVVHTVGPHDNAKVAEVAGDLALKLIAEIGEYRATKTVGLGLGPGRATLDFCRYFGAAIKSMPLFPKLRLVAISAGCPATLPAYASSSFIHYFPADHLRETIGLFAESVVLAKDFHRVKKTPGVHEAFDARRNDIVDVVITSMGDFADPHDLLGMFLSDAGMGENFIRKKKWIGNVQYRPYTASGPVVEAPDEYRAVTLFELSDLVQMSNQKHKHVILIARQCGDEKCGKTRARALYPILTNSELRVFSHLVLDAATAKDLLKG